MEVKLISYPRNILEIMYTAARTCYSKDVPNTNTVMVKTGLLDNVLASGHTSIAEHINFTFSIEGISRAASHQLVRHRHATFSQQSQRYVDMSDPDFVVPDNLPKESYIIIGKVLNDIRVAYHNLLELGVKKEDARCILPNCTGSNMIVTMNLRELMHIANLRLCKRAQKEIREIVLEMCKAVERVEPFLSDYLVAKCEAVGYCTEENSCGRRPKLGELS